MIQFLTSWNGHEFGTIASLGGAEAGLIAAGLARAYPVELYSDRPATLRYDAAGTLLGIVSIDPSTGAESVNAIGGGSGSSTFAGLTDKATADLPATNTPLSNALAAKATLQVGALVASTTASPNATAVQNAIAALVNSAPGTLDTLNELAAALGSDPNFATTIAATIAAKVANDMTASTTVAPSKTAAQTAIDAKVADNLTASTSIAPSKTAVNTALAGKADVLAAVALTGATTLNRAAHGNRQITFTGANANLTIDSDAGGGWTADDSVEVHTLTGSAGVPTLITPDGKSIAGSPTKVVGATRKGTDAWTVGTTDPAAAGGGSGVAANVNSIASASLRMIGPRVMADNQMFVVGLVAPTVIDSCTYGTPTTANGSFGFWIRNRHVAAAAAVNRGMGYVLSTTTAMLRLDSAGTPHGNFPCRVPFAIGNGSGSGMRLFVGISGNPTATDYTADPSARVTTDCFFVGADAADTNLYIGWNDNVGTPVKTTLGANFPKAVDTPYIAIFDHIAGVMQLTLLNVGTGDIATVVQSGGDAPRTTISYGLQIMGGTGTDTSSDSIDIGIVTLGGPSNTIGT